VYNYKAATANYLCVMSHLCAVFLKTKLETLEAEIQCAKLELAKTSEALKMTESVNS